MVAQSTNISYAVIVLGDHGTLEVDDLAVKAAEQGAVIAESYSFEPGEPASSDDLAEVDAVVSALSRAIATRTDIWVPFPIADFGREEHLRRVSLVLQRHGLNMLMGRELEPCTTDGGFNPIDFALRAEVRAVDGLDFAVIAGAGVNSLAAEIERGFLEYPPADEPGDHPDERGDHPHEPADPPAPRRARAVKTPGQGERHYGTGEVARFFGRPIQWVNAALRNNDFVREDGSIIEPVRIGKGQRRRFSLTDLDEMLRSCYRRGLVTEDEYLSLVAALFCERMGR
ncbi:MAG: hypothetical protein NT146_00750 [Mycobacterium sp.]|nr:hypothetical protein [Mycobacterium sp.]